MAIMVNSWMVTRMSRESGLRTEWSEWMIRVVNSQAGNQDGQKMFKIVFQRIHKMVKVYVVISLVKIFKEIQDSNKDS